jgi:hypothetical protein
MNLKLFGACLGQEVRLFLYGVRRGLQVLRRRLLLLFLALLYVAIGAFVAYHLAFYLAGALAGPAADTPATMVAFTVVASVIYLCFTMPFVILFGNAMAAYRERIKKMSVL